MIKEINLAEFPIMQVSISGDVSPVQLKEIADDMQDAIETLPGVLKVEVLGALEPEIRMEFDRDRMAMYNLVISDIMQLIPTENVNISAGGLETEGTKFNVRIPAEFVSRRGGGSPADRRARRQADLPGRRGHGAGRLQGSDHLLPFRTASRT